MSNPEAPHGAEESLENLRGQLARLREASEITIPGYTVTSHAPVIGPLLARLRRMFTSHLREPYIDPILERQEAFNRELVQTVEQLTARLEANDRQVSQAATLDAEHLEQARRTLDECAQQLAILLDIVLDKAGKTQSLAENDPSPDEIAALRSRLNDVRTTLTHPGASRTTK